MKNPNPLIGRASRKLVAGAAAVVAIASTLLAPHAVSALIIIQPTSCIEYANNECVRYQACAIDTDNRTYRCDRWSRPESRPGIQQFETVVGTY